MFFEKRFAFALLLSLSFHGWLFFESTSDSHEQKYGNIGKPLKGSLSLVEKPLISLQSIDLSFETESLPPDANQASYIEKNEAAAPRNLSAHPSSKKRNKIAKTSEVKKSDIKQLALNRIASIASEMRFYPDDAKSRGSEGTAYVFVIFDGSGHPSSSHILTSSGDSSLDAAAIELVSLLNGDEFSHRTLSLPVAFKLY